METYIYNAYLLVKSFEGVIKEGKNNDEEINKLESIIDVIQSVGEKIKLWSYVSLIFHSNKFVTEFNKIVSEKIQPLLNQLDRFDINYKISVFAKIAPSIFYYSESAFFEEMKDYSNEDKDKIIYNVFNYVFNKKYFEEPVDEIEKGVELLHFEYIQLKLLLEQATDDSLIFIMIKKISTNLQKNLNRKIVGEQKNRLIHDLSNIIDNKLPNSSTGISHKGYWIASKVSLLSIDDYNRKKQEWEDLINEARLIPNLSDKALVLILIAELMPQRQNLKRQKTTLLDEAFDLIKTIPSNYDKTNRFDATWDVWKDIGKNEFCSRIRIAYEELLKNNDGTLMNIKNLVDVAHQHDTKFAEEMVTLLDQEPGRKILKEPLLKRIESKNKIKNASEQLSKLNELSAIEYNEVFNRKLALINSHKIACVNLDKNYEILEVLSKRPLSLAFSSLSYFIQNEISRIHPDFNLINTFFEAFYLNAKLIATFSADNVEKMKNLFKYTNIEQSVTNPIFRHGESQKLLDYLQEWIFQNVNEEIIFIDPYFNENQLEFLKIISDIKPECDVKILTSKKSNQISDSLNETYSNSWNSLTENTPPNNKIIIVWDRDTNECPFHDRWLLSDDCSKGLILNSINSNGFKRDTQINELNDDATKNVEKTVVLDYIYKQKTRVNEFNLEYYVFKVTK